MRWDEIPGWCDYEELYQEIVKKYPSGTLVEVGCYLGRSLCYLGYLVKLSGKPFSVIGVDHCRGSGEENGTDNHGAAVKQGGKSFAGQLYNNIIDCGVADVVSLVVADSVKASKLFPDNSLEFVFLDASHDYQSVKQDILYWLPKVKHGGVLAGDDLGVEGEIAPVWPGVGDAVRECLPGWRHFPHDAWWFTKE